MVGNPGDLLGVQARIEGVQNPASATDAKVKLQVAVAVPGQGGHPAAEFKPQAVKRMGYLARARRQGFVIGAVDIPLDPPRHDFSLAMVALGKIDHR